VIRNQFRLEIVAKFFARCSIDRFALASSLQSPRQSLLAPLRHPEIHPRKVKKGIPTAAQARNLHPCFNSGELFASAYRAHQAILNSSCLLEECTRKKISFFSLTP
jgi:hypothetical protein